ncbi:MAG: AI-2E family transporter [Syntrophothermus sp.]
MSIYTIKQSKYITLAMIMLLGLFLAYALIDIVPSILGAIVLYTLFKPLYMFFINKLKFKKSIGAVLIIIITLLIIVLPFIALSWMLIEKITVYLQHPELITKTINDINSFIGNKIDNPNFISDSIKDIGNYAVGMLQSAVSFALNLFLIVSIMYFILFFMLVKWEVFEGTLSKYVPFRQKNIEHFSTELKNSTFSNVVGQGMIAFAQGASLTLGFFIFGISDGLFWGVVAMFLSFLPVIGSVAIWVPAGVIALANGHTIAGIGILLWGLIIITNIDNVLRLIINKKFGNIHPMITIIGVVIGLPIFGILGLVYGPLLISFFLILIKLYEGAFVDDLTPEKEPVVQLKEIQNKPKE